MNSEVWCTSQASYQHYGLFRCHDSFKAWGGPLSTPFYLVSVSLVNSHQVLPVPALSYQSLSPSFQSQFEKSGCRMSFDSRHYLSGPAEVWSFGLACLCTTASSKRDVSLQKPCSAQACGKWHIEPILRTGPHIPDKSISSSC
jgi:hypothetical protein